jgi:hypothetical protein
MYSYKYDVSLRISHPKMEPDEICKKLSLEAKFMWEAGTQAKTPTGRSLNFTRKDTYCSFKLEHPPEKELVDFLKSCNEKFYIHKEYFEHIRSTGGRIEYFIGYYCDKNCGVIFDIDLLESLVKLKIDLSLDFYGEST